MKSLIEAIKAPESVRVTSRERTVLGLVKHIMLENEFIIKQSMYLALSDSLYGSDIDRTNLISRMANTVRKRMKGKVNGVNRFSQAGLFVDVAQQLYWLDQSEDIPLISESFAYGFDGHIKTHVRPRFIPMDLSPQLRKGIEKKIPLYRKCSDTIYRPSHVIGKAWDIFSKDQMEHSVMIGSYSKDLLKRLYEASSDYNDLNRKESQSDRIVRADAAIDYLVDHVMNKALTFSAVPDARTRVAKQKLYFTDTAEELDVRHIWFINWFGESWQTTLYERYEKYEVTEAGLEDLEVAMTRAYWKKETSQRLSWRKARNMFKKENITILNFCSNYYDHGVYYPRMAKIYRGGLGRITGFMIEADLSASGIGTAAMNIRSKPMAIATALAGSATPADAHRTVVEEILHTIMEKKDAKALIHAFYKIIKKKNVEITHAQSVAVTARTWNKLLDDLGADHEELTSEVLREVYDREMPGLLDWIESMTSITQVGVRKGFPVLYFHAKDGARCATSAYTESRLFKSRAVDKNLKSKTILFQMRMPIEVIDKRIIWDSYENKEDAKLKNKMMGVWANGIQAEDAYGKRKNSREFKAIHGYVPFVKHDGYHVKLGHVKSLTIVIYDWRVEQFEEQPMRGYFNEMADFLNIQHLELADGDMVREDMNYHNVGEAPFMMT